MIVDSGVRFEFAGKKGLYHYVHLNKNLSEAVTWCLDNFGDNNDIWFYSKNKFIFTKREDMTLFLMRWS